MFGLKGKTGRLFLIYFAAVIIIVLIASLLFVMRNEQARNTDKKAAVFVLDEAAMEMAYKNKMINLDFAELKRYSDLKDEIQREIAAGELAFIVSLCLGIGIATLFLYRSIKKQRMADLHEFVEMIDSMNETVYSGADNNIRKLYTKLEKHFEENLKSYKKLSAYLSHEQKNALFLLRAKLEYDGHREYLKQLDDVAASMEDILTISDTDEEQVMEETDCVLICAELCDSCQKLRNPVRFSFSEDDCTILAKPRWIERAVSNLLDNAVKYGNGEPVELSIERKYNNVIITVADHGCGIPKNEQEKIFKNRYRVKELNKDGYGIGLSLVTHVCDLCGGFVWVDSESNQGSTFYLSFPAAECL